MYNDIDIVCAGTKRVLYEVVFIQKEKNAEIARKTCNNSTAKKF